MEAQQPETPTIKPIEVPQKWSVCTITIHPSLLLKDREIRSILELQYDALVMNPKPGIFHVSNPQNNSEGFFSFLQDLRNRLGNTDFEILFEGDKEIIKTPPSTADSSKKNSRTRE